jgi:hypothetical protein
LGAPALDRWKARIDPAAGAVQLRSLFGTLLRISSGQQK